MAFALLTLTHAVIHFSRLRDCDEKKMLLFIDASPSRCQPSGEHSHLSVSCRPRIHEQTLDGYIPSTFDADTVNLMVELLGARLVFYLDNDTNVAWRL